jgi:hypothetical protein
MGPAQNEVMPVPQPDWSVEITIRPAAPDDAPRLRRLAELETRAPIPGPHLIALRGGAAVAAISLASGEILADPFHPTLDVQELLRLQARRAARTLRRDRGRRRRLTRPALSGA